MREHQIVINLKPEQFEEVQRMASAAGSKSVSVFVRQKLISLLGLMSQGGSADDGADEPDLRQLTGELRRLHRELQIFVADSLSNSDYTMATMEAAPFPTAVQENFLAEGAPLMPESMDRSYYTDSREQSLGPVFPGQYSNSQFANQFSYGGIGSGSSAFAPYEVPGDSVMPGESAVTEEAVADSVSSADRVVQLDYVAPRESGLAPYEIPPGAVQSFASSSQDPQSATQPVYSIPQAPPETESTPPMKPTAPARPVLPVSPQQNVSVTKSFAENDELEDLAERAFAISPRLGHIAEPVKRFPDPLKDLLDDGLFNDEEDLDFESEEKIGESSDLEVEDAPSEHIEQSLAQEELSDQNAYINEQTEADSPTTHELATRSSSETERFEEETSESDSGDLESADMEDATTATGPGPPDPPQQFPPPISGGPPPRKRRT